ncbi:hypothetical protein FNF29_05352 [Cafeteria roenbergensis]|uniref:PPM-type phosphatase domain-containing protein n=1 Tax=Cafeteria roenbergensis TaxID=33653 RepID=A0A5A8D4F9_CAFRO|nr:hypothetical protein FNF29_05352 [Cafeteria roenbergensis]KAA0160256.1 hypothetical protein FNF31_04421 [Cafeteria roenbergensis]KAA0160727.1 hypothetical protein FNF28_05363 [Cafeteria roenbergensis]|eukprot:KAA0150340.1 hypothetical protein FNF29_05352 [Cafeteria roenbergensis]
MALGGPALLSRQHTVTTDEDTGGTPAAAAGAAGSSSSSAAAAAAARAPYTIEAGGITDPGVHGKQNQDDFFVEVIDAAAGDCIVGVFDGHGRELGQLAARTAKNFVRDELRKEEVRKAIERDPKDTFDAVFCGAHKAIEATFAAHYTDAGWLVSRAAEGFLTRRRSEGSATMCVHGGTTATVMVIYGGRRAVVANVGDSSALLCGGHATAHVMRAISTWPGSATAPAEAAPASAVVARPEANPEHAAGPTQMEMSADHSPESDAEFFRMRDARPSLTDKSRPELLFVYDTLTSSKMSCPQIFHVDPSTGRARRTNRGSYYKNVRNEWATLVATPAFAQFQDALAFTRSLGDLHLQSYGVSHLPEVRWIDLAPAGPDGVPAPATAGPICIAACSDGIWDNWKFHDVASFVLHRERMAHPDAQARTVALMSTNLERAHINFGNSADNMTAVCIYLTPSKPAAHGTSSSSSSSAGAAAAAAAASPGH